MAAAFFLGQTVDFSFKLGVRCDGTRLGQNLTALNVIFLQTAEQNTSIVTGFTTIELLLKHFNAGHDRLCVSRKPTIELRRLN